MQTSMLAPSSQNWILVTLYWEDVGEGTIGCRISASNHYLSVVFSHEAVKGYSLPSVVDNSDT